MQRNVGQVIELAREWVEQVASQMPGFCGAHLMGGLNHTPKEALFPDYKDVDLNVLLQAEDLWQAHDLLYQGLNLEYGAVSVSAYRSAEVVLADPRLASNLAVDSLLADPTGLLAALHARVAVEYPRRKWVLARCETAQQSARDSLQGLSQASSPSEAFFYIGLLVLDLCGLIAIAGLRPPTHRRAPVLAKEVLETYGLAELHEELLRVFGSAPFSPARVEAYLPVCGRAFDKAVEVRRSPVPFGFKLHAHVKPYFIQGAQEMIDQGYHREALHWIASGILIATNAIQLDAPEAEKPEFLENAQQLFADLGLAGAEGLSPRIQQASQLTERVFQAAQTIVSQNPVLVD